MLVGERLNSPQSCCLLQAVKRLPQTLECRNLREAITQRFFENGVFWSRGWHIYYVYVPDTDEQLFLLLVPLAQVEQLLSEVNSVVTRVILNIPENAAETGFVLDFCGGRNFAPRFLGQPNSQHDFNVLRRFVPPPNFVPAEEHLASVQDAEEFALWKQKLLASLRLAENTRLLDKEAAQAHRRIVQAEKQAKRQTELFEAEVYLGLRPPISPQSDAPLPTIPEYLARVDVEKIVPYAIDTSVVFVCIDTESHETKHYVTEIGLAILDTADVFDIPPGHCGQNWGFQVDTRHIRVQEHLRHTNHRYLKGCPDKFDFGRSEVVPIRKASTVVRDVFTQALGRAPARYGGDVLPNSQRRKCFLVGHAVKGDIDVLKRIGYDVIAQHGSSIIDIIDTAVIHQALRQLQQSTSLVKVLAEFGIEARNLHNAGNDAAYTLKAMLAIIVTSAVSRHLDTPSLV